jgi:RTX calcium-binding nonapeptide repeat (4 copies)
LDGDPGNDNLFGDEGDDQLFGDSGRDDLCDGGPGNDVQVILPGGAATCEVVNELE